MKVFGLAGWSGSGKTTLLVRLMPALVARGISVSTIKHAHHGFDVDRPGKDSHAHRLAGAREVMVSSANRFALMHALRGAPEPTVEELVARMSPVDLLLIEGFKHHAHDKLEVHRPALGKPLLAAGDPRVVAVASVARLEGLSVPVLPLDDVEAIAGFVLARCDLVPARGG
ncbi:MAG: molybdopterin-guanine dinucleotide biosynthesis protein B [Alphaproteobacteria bacterium]